MNESIDNVSWSLTAQVSYIESLNFLLENGYFNFAQKLDELISEFIGIICLYPEMYPLIEEFNVRRAVIHKDFIITYRQKNNNIEIVDFVYSGSNHPY